VFAAGRYVERWVRRETESTADLDALAVANG
jgi:hypothetical protein